MIKDVDLELERFPQLSNQAQSNYESLYAEIQKVFRSLWFFFVTEEIDDREKKGQRGSKLLNFKMEEEDMKHFRFRDLLEAVKSKITDCSLEVPDSITAILYISCPSNIWNNFSCRYLK